MDGGASNTGVIFEWDLSTNSYVKKVDSFTSSGVPAFQFLPLGEPVLHSIEISGIDQNIFYPGTSFNISFSVSGTFSPGNTFTAELSDATGNFTSPLAIGTLQETTSGTIAASIPSNTATGGAYRIRIVSSHPSVISADNGTDFMVNQPPGASVEGSTTVCGGSTADLSVAFTGLAPWTLAYEANELPQTLVSSESTHVLTVSPGETTIYELVSVADRNGFTVALAGEAIVTVNTAPVLVTPEDLFGENEAGKCGSEIVFEASASGAPEPDITYTIAETAISSPYFFSVGRTTVTAVATNVCGTASASFDVTVENALPVISSINISADPRPVGTNVPVVVTVNDNNAMSGTIAWGDGMSSSASIEGTEFSAGHLYAAAGVYTVNITVVDQCGDETTLPYQYVVVYDPSAAFVTGGGWFHSTEGAYVPNPQATGKASFGFVAKYQKGASVPVGNTDFQFHGEDLSFRSTSYEWLVVAGYKAMFKGVGNLNGSVGFGFQISAVDGGKSASGSTDKLRIKIWDPSGMVVYDNQNGAADDVEAATALGGGSIVIHDGGKSSSATARMIVSDDGVSEPAEEPMSAYPNPFEHRLIVRYLSEVAEPVGIQLMDITGRSVYDREHEHSQEGLYEVNLLPSASSQFYLVRISQGKRVGFIKVMGRR
jgi:hypothetical protein